MAAALSAAVLWLLVEAFSLPLNILLPVVITVIAAGSTAFSRKRGWLVSAVWLAVGMLILVVLWRQTVSGIAAFLNAVLDTWKRLHPRNIYSFAVAEKTGLSLLMCAFGAVLGVWSAGFVRRRSTASFRGFTLLLCAIGLLFAPRCSAGWLLVAAMTELLAYAVCFGGSGVLDAWTRVAAVLLGVALALGGWNYREKPTLLSSTTQRIEEGVQQLRYGNNDYAGLPEGKLGTVGARRTTGEIVLKVTMQAPASYYLRGFTGEIYENNCWHTLDAETLCMAGDSFYWLHSDGFYPQAQIASAAAAAWPEVAEEENTLQIENVGLSSRYLYAPYELLTDSAGLDPAAIGDRTLLAQGFYGQRKYSLHAGIGLITQYQKINAKLWQNSDEKTFLNNEGIYNSFVYQNYTAIPADIRSYLTDKLGEYAVENEETHFDYQNAKQNILYYLSTYVSYEENDITPVGNGIDFVLNFLDGTKKGYSIHYATAAALMFRYYGIPARYVEGFLITRQEAQDMQPGQTLSLDGSHAHAWVEYYQDGVGWLPFEVTPAYFSTMEQVEKYRDISGLIGQLPQDRTADNIEDMPQSTDTQDPTLVSFWLKHRLEILLGIAILLLMVLLFLFILWLVWERKKAARRKATFRSDDVATAIREIYRYMMDVLCAQGIQPQNCPPEEYAVFLDEDLRSDYLVSVAIWKEASFSGHSMQEEQRQRILSLTEEVWCRAWKRAGLLERIRLKYVYFL